MIQLHSDCLVFKTKGGDYIPCSAEALTLELTRKTSEVLDPELVLNAAAAVSHYFQHEVQRTCVSVSEFADALAMVLRSFGIKINLEEAEESEPQEGTSSKPMPQQVGEIHLGELAIACGEAGYELAFFPRLREHVSSQMETHPQLLRVHELRRCVKALTGNKRWTRRCRQLRDQIVAFLRAAWADAARRTSTQASLIIQ